MILDEIKKIESTLPKLREFGFVVGGVLCALGIFLAWRGRGTYPYFFLPGITLVITGTVLPGALKPFQKAWMTLAILMNWIMTRVLFSVLFCVAITPIGLILRLAGRDLFDRKLDQSKKSYWNVRSKPLSLPADHERQF